jgi:hypothetical protein
MNCLALPLLLRGGDPVGDLGAFDFCEGRAADDVGEEDRTCSASPSFFACDTLEGEDFFSSFFTSLGLSGDLFIDLVLLRLLLLELLFLLELSDFSGLFAWLLSFSPCRLGLLATELLSFFLFLLRRSSFGGSSSLTSPRASGEVGSKLPAATGGSVPG